MSPGQKFAYWVYVFFAVLCALTFAWLLYITIKVMKLTGKSDRATPAMLVCLQASMISK